MTAGDDDCPVVAEKLGKARKIGVRLKRILSREGADKRISGNFQGGSSTGAAVWGGDVGVDSKNREDVGIVHAWVRATDYGETAAERVGQKMVLTLSGGSHEGSGI